ELPNADQADEVVFRHRGSDVRHPNRILAPGRSPGNFRRLLRRRERRTALRIARRETRGTEDGSRADTETPGIACSRPAPSGTPRQPCDGCLALPATPP